ncbi:MAG: hypothetical protein PVG76_10900, partial [Chromatiales bacterium]
PVANTTIMEKPGRILPPWAVTDAARITHAQHHRRSGCYLFRLLKRFKCANGTRFSCCYLLPNFFLWRKQLRQSC